VELLFAGAAPDLHAGRCLNRRHAGAGCTRCVDGCPVQAIALYGVTPHLNDDACVRCGVCTTLCPTDSFVAVTDYEKALRATVANLPTAPTALVCSAHPAPNVTAANVSVVVQHRRCLAVLAPADLLELSAGGARPLWLDDSPCNACPIGAAQATLARTVEAVRTLLHTAGCPPALLLHSERPPTADARMRRAPLHDGAQPAISRRALLKRLRPQQPAGQEEPVLDDLLQRGASVSARLPQQTPASRRRLLAVLAALRATDSGELATAHLPFSAVQVDADRCSSCGLCARFCPTGALQFTQMDARFALAFQPAACVACNICVVACPEDAVRLGDTVNLATILTDAVTPLMMGELVPCAGCGVLTARHADDPAPRCHVCRQGAGVVTAQRDDAGLMADLLARAQRAAEAEWPRCRG
jgi:ferredoxin